MSSELAHLYEQDFHAWVEVQAKALRDLAQRRWNGPLDLAHLAEEVEDLGKAERNAVLSLLQTVIEHLLKLEYSTASEPRRQWQLSVNAARDRLERHLTPTLSKLARAELPDLYRRARRDAALGLADHGESETARKLPALNHYTLEDLVREGWWPGNRCGVVDGGA